MRVANALFASAVVLSSTGVRASDEDPDVQRARAEAHATLAAIDESARTMRDLLRAVRKRGKRAEIACVDEALSRTDVASRRARDDAAAVVAARARGDADDARAAERRLLLMRDAARVAVRQGRACVAPPPPPRTRPVLGTIVRVEIDPSIPPWP